MRKTIFRSLAAVGIILAGLISYGTFHPESAFSAFAPCTVASVACFYKVVDSGGVNVANINAAGQQAIQQLPTVLTTGSAWTSATSVNTTQTIFTATNVKVVLVQIDVTSTITGGAVTFQVSYDGTNYVAPSTSQVLDPTSPTLAQVSLPYTLVASTNKPFLILTRGAQALQIKLSTAITGTATLTPYFALLPEINFNEVNVIAPLPAGANAIGSVTQGSPPWADNITQFGSTNIATGTGAGGAGIPRVTVSNDSSLAANQSTNVNQFGGSAVATGTGAGGAGIPRVTVSNDSSLAANQSVNLNQVGGTAVVADPCEAIVKTYKPISITANTQIITGTAAKQTYICSINLGPLGTATNVALVEGSGTTCATSTLGMAGGNTAATGWGIGANGGLVMGDGIGAVAATATLANNVCLFVSAANQVSGVIAWVQK